MEQLNRPQNPQDLFVSGIRKPKYGQIQDSILSLIQSGEWSPGDRIPPERELAQIFASSVGTVRNALQNLVSQGYLIREQGRGTFVRKSIEHTDALRYFRFVNSFKDEIPSLLIKCLHPPHLETSPEIAEILALPPTDQLFVVDRLFLNGEKPMVYVTSYLSQTLFPDFDRFSCNELEEIPIYLLIEQAYNMPTLATSERFSAVAADEKVAAMLQMTPGAPVQKIMMTAVTTRKTVYEYQVSFCDTTDRQIYRECPGGSSFVGI